MYGYVVCRDVSAGCLLCCVCVGAYLAAVGGCVVVVCLCGIGSV